MATLLSNPPVSDQHMPVLGFYQGPRPAAGEEVLIGFISRPAQRVGVYAWQPEESRLLYRTPLGELFFADLLP